MSDVTHILDRVQQGDPKAADELLPLVYEELRKLAAQKMTHEAAGQTLQATALVHEAWLRLANNPADQQWANRGHFFAAAAEAMRRILIENARRKSRLKRGGDWERVELENLQLASDSDPTTLLSLDEALGELAVRHPDHAQLVKLRFFAGLSLPETALAMGLSQTTAKRYWAFARGWLFDRMDGER